MPQPPRLLLQHNSETVETLQAAGLDVAIWSSRSPVKETPNEDAIGVIEVSDKAAVLTVADGLGGQRGGAQASNLAVELLAQGITQLASQMTSADHPSLLRVGILDAIERANVSICNLNIGAATTLALVEYRAGNVRTYHIGDSMILIVGQRGRIHYQTVPHSPVGFAIEAGLLDEEDALHHEDRHIVSNVVGDDQMRIEMGSPLRLAPRDTVLLASDGLFDNLRIEEIVEIIRKGPVGEAVTKLVTLARQRMQRWIAAGEMLASGTDHVDEMSAADVMHANGESADVGGLPVAVATSELAPPEPQPGESALPAELSLIGGTEATAESSQPAAADSNGSAASASDGNEGLSNRTSSSIDQRPGQPAAAQSDQPMKPDDLTVIVFRQLIKRRRTKKRRRKARPANGPSKVDSGAVSSDVAGATQAADVVPVAEEPSPDRSVVSPAPTKPSDDAIPPATESDGSASGT